MIKQIIKKILYRMRGDYTVETLVQMGLTVGKNFNPQKGYNLDPSHCWLITIGDDVTMAPNVQVLAHDASTCQSLGYAKIGKVNIGSRVFIGAGSIILPNTSIGNNVIIGAGSVVTCDIPDGVVYAGNPAKKICDMETYLQKNKIAMQSRPVYDESYTLRCNIDANKKEEQKKALESGIGYVI